VFALIYSSVSKASEDDLNPLLATSQRNNERDGVTGCLLYVYDEEGGPAYFAQILEGRQETVEAAYARIAQDRRHRDVRLLSRGPLRDRRFAGSPLRLAELPTTRVLASGGTSVEAVMRDAEAMASLLASYGDDPVPLNPATPWGSW
jgi:hypothetical protein